MLLISLFVGFLSPFTAFAIKSVSLPKIEIFKYTFVDLINTHRDKYLELYCAARGSPTPKIDFELNNVILRNSSRVIRVSSNRIIIKNVSYDMDEGKYKCVASNIHGRVFKEKFVQIETMGNFMKGNTIKDDLKFIYVTLGHPAEIRCPDHTKTHPVKYLWGSVGPPLRLIQDNKRMSVLDNGILHIASVSRQDIKLVNKVHGGISCIIFSKGLKKFSNKIALAYDEEYSADVPARVYHHLPGQIYLEKGESITLKCVANGNPIPDIKWFRNGEQINSNDSKYGINPFLPGRLTIKDYIDSMAGQYKCVVRNRAGKDETYTNLKTALPPALKYSNDVTLLTRARDTRILLQCSATGTSPMTYHWYRNGRLLTSYTTHNSSMTVTDEELSINHINYGHVGTYQCFVTNKYGEASNIFKVAVKEPVYVNSKQVDSKSSTSPPPVNNSVSEITEKSSKDTEKLFLETKYIIIIACGGAVLVLVIIGGMVIYCRTKDDIKNTTFISAPQHHMQIDPGYPAYTDVSTLPHPPSELTNYSDDDEPVFYDETVDTEKRRELIRLMSEMRSREEGKEHFYYDIPDIKYQEQHPSTEL